MNKWRIRINASKCKALENEHVSGDLGGKDSVYMLGGPEIRGQGQWSKCWDANELGSLRGVGVGLPMCRIISLNKRPSIRHSVAQYREGGWVGAGNEPSSLAPQHLDHWPCPLNKVQMVKYLGVGLNSKGARAHDKAKEAEATQSRFKLRTTRAKLGEGVAAEQLRSQFI